MYYHRVSLVAVFLGLGPLAMPASGQVRQAAKPPAPAPAPTKDLQITIEEPADWAPAASGMRARDVTVAARSSIKVSGLAKHPLGISQVLLNKNIASIADEPDGSTRFTGYVHVEEKMTSAEVTVVTRTGLRVSEKYNITPTKPPPPAATPKAAWEEKTGAVGFSGKRYAVVIGISRYQDKEITGLKYADEDAKAVYDFLRSPLAGMGGIEPENIKILLNEDATYRNMRVALFEFLKNANENDVVYIYFAGHGAPDPDRRDNLYLLPFDTQASQMGGTGFAMEDMNKALREVTAAHKILITDACHSGGITKSGSRGLELNDINNAFLTRLSSSKGVHAAFTASGPNQLSFEGDQWGGGHGVFTHYLLKGLGGAADENNDHLVDLGELMKFVTDSVAAATNRKQVPMTSPTAFDASFPVALVLPGQEIRKIGLDEIAKYNKVSNVMTASLESPWIPPDSMTLVAGVPDTLRIRLQNDTRDTLPARLLKWTSSNKSVATIDSNGVITPVAPGTVQISASRETRKVTTLVRVVPKASQVVFFPTDTVLQLVLGEHIQIHADLLSDQWMRGMAPRVTLTDTLSLSPRPGLEYVAYREGTVVIDATIAGRAQRWLVHVVQPALKIKPLPLTVPIDDSVSLGAWRVRPDNGIVLSEAANVVWRSTDTTRVVVRNGRLLTRGIGRAVIVATMGNAVDSVATTVLGELLIGTKGDGGETISTVALGSGKVVSLLPKGVHGSEPALSPKGDKIAFVSDNRLHVMDADGTNERRLTPDMKGMLGVRMSTYQEHYPSWTNDGTRVVFISNAHGNFEVLSIAADGSDIKRLTKTSEKEGSVSAAYDAPQIAYDRTIAQDASDIVIALPDGSGERQFHTDPGPRDPSVFAVKPKFMPGALEIVYARKWPDRGGESLHLLDVKKGETTKDLFAQQKDQSLIFAISPDGQYIAVHRIPYWGGGTSAILILDRNGATLKTIQVAGRVDIESISWGASATRPKDTK